MHNDGSINSRPAGPRKVSPHAHIVSPGRGATQARSTAQHSGRNTGGDGLQLLSKHRIGNSLPTSRVITAISKPFPNPGAGEGAQPGESKLVPGTGAREERKCPSHPWLLRGPHSQLPARDRPNANITAVHFPSSSPSTHRTDMIDGQTMAGRARGGGSRRRGGVKSPWRCGSLPPPARRYAYGDSCLTPSRPGGSFSVGALRRRPPERGCPIFRAICPDRICRGPPGAFNPVQLFLRLGPPGCPPRLCPGLLCPRSGAGVRLTGLSQRASRSSCQRAPPTSTRPRPRNDRCWRQVGPSASRGWGCK